MDNNQLAGQASLSLSHFDIRYGVWFILVEVTKKEWYACIKIWFKVKNKKTYHIWISKSKWFEFKK